MDHRSDASDRLLLSVVVAIVSDTTDSRVDTSHLKGCLEALTHQIDAPAMEIIVPYRPSVGGINELERQFPSVVFLQVDKLKTFTGQGGSREHHDELRARGLGVARGEIIGLLEDHARPDLQWCAAMVEAHRQSYSAVGGAIENGIDRPLNWAVYFCDFGKYQNPVHEGESPFASDANVSYKRSALEPIKSVWQEAFHEPTVNWALKSRGQSLALASKAIVFQHRSNLQLKSALKERFVWGRSYAATRSELEGSAKRLVYAVLTPILPVVLLGRMVINVVKKRRNAGAFLKVFPLTAILTVSWALGELTGYLTARGSGMPGGVSEGIN